MVMVIALLVTGHGVSFSADTTKSNSEQEFCRLDKDNNREISFGEFAACEFYKLEHVRALPFSESKDLMKGGNDSRSDDELKAYLFDKADRNKNGMIDRKEWEEFYNSLIEPGGGIPHRHIERR
jgi:Ca2+-binding EF-hand superfamily protein